MHHEPRIRPYSQSDGEGPANIIATSKSPLKFFVLVFALSVPFWLLGAVTELQLLPGLPMSALAVFCPAIAASILVHTENRAAGMTTLLKRAFDYQRITAKGWYAPIVLFMPGVMVLSYGLMRVMGMPVPTPQFSVLAAVLMFLAFFVAAVGEELGWSGYVTDPMQGRWTALQTSVGNCFQITGHITTHVSPECSSQSRPL